MSKIIEDLLQDAVFPFAVFIRWPALTSILPQPGIRGMELGCNDFVLKPLDRTEVRYHL